MKRQVFVLFLLAVLSLPPAALADVDARTVRTIRLPEPARQISISPQGRNYFVLGDKTLYLYTIEGQLLGQTEVGRDVTSIAAQSDNLVLMVRKGQGRIDYYLVDPIQQIDVGDSPIRGAVDAPVTLVVFDDFQCPYCARTAPVLKQVLDNNPKTVRLVLKNFPLQMHPFARKAALAALAAGRQGKYWQMHDLLFENSRQLSDKKIEALARQLKLDMDRWRKDMNDPALQARIDADLRQGQKLGVRGTPTLYVNGRLVRDRSPQGLQQLIDAALRNQN